MDTKNTDYAFKLGIYYEFARELPAETKVASGV